MEKKEIDALNIYPNKSSKVDVLTPHKIIVVSIDCCKNEGRMDDNNKSHSCKF